LSTALTSSEAEAATTAPLTPKQFRKHALQLRKDVAQQNADDPAIDHQSNGDEDRYANRIASYSKGLQHSDNGEVIAASYESMLQALKTGAPAGYDAISLGGVRAQIGPQAGLGYELEGGDPRSFALCVPPCFSSREEAGEISENYWMALLRDTPFQFYSSDPVAGAAAADLSTYGADSKVPKDALGRVTPELLFRGVTAGDRVGPYLSQLFFLPLGLGVHPVDRQFVSYAANVNFLTTFSDYLACQRGAAPTQAPVAGRKGYPVNGRDLVRWVHVDFQYQAYLFAAFSLFGKGAPLNPSNPYRTTPKQGWLGLFGELAQVSANALRAAFYQKWYVHRRLRPEVFAARIHRTLYSGASYPVHASVLGSLSSSSGLGGYVTAGNALLSQAYPEGCPNHPAYPAAHAVVAGACATLLKAIFDGSWVLPAPVEPTADGATLAPYTGAALTLGGEVDKLASNISLGRNIAGVHWRSDATEGLRLGEEIALHFLEEYVQTTNENMHFSLTTFDGTSIVV
jgi:hypothetical protein